MPTPNVPTRTRTIAAVPRRVLESAQADRISATSRPTRAYSARAYISDDGPRQCPSAMSAPDSATAASISGSARPPETSLTMRAPARTAAAAVAGSTPRQVLKVRICAKRASRRPFLLDERLKIKLLSKQ